MESNNLHRTVRLATEDDAEAIAAIYGPFCELGAVSFEVSRPTRDQMAERIRTITKQWPWLVLEDAGRVVGYAYASRHQERAAYDWAVNTAVYVAEHARSMGGGRALYLALFDVLRLQGYFKACAGITVPNPVSVGLHEAFGFRLVGVYRGIGYKQGAWHDVAWYEAAVQPERASPPPPRPVTEFVETPLWREALKRALASYGG